MRAMLLLLLAQVAAAQAVPPGFWTGWNGLFSQGCSSCVLNPDGSVLASFTLPGPLGVSVKHQSGVVFVQDGASLRAYDLAGPTGLSITSPGTGIVNAAAAQSTGDLFIVDGAIFSSSTIYRVDLAGNVIFSVPLIGASFGTIEPDPFGGAWVSETLANGNFSLSLLDFGGGMSGPFTVPGTGGGSVRADPAGFGWVLRSGGAFVRMDPGGVPVVQTVLTGALSFDVDACGRPHVLMSGSPSHIDIYDPTSLVIVRSIPLSAATIAPTLFSLDSLGNYWFTNSNAFMLEVISPDGALRASIPTLATPTLTRGDPSGLHLASITRPFDDLDLDGFTSAHELLRGTDPFDPTSSPIPLVLAGGQPGTTLTISGSFPQDAGLSYIIGASGGSSGISLFPLGCREVPLDLDPILTLWLDPMVNSFTTGVVGTVPPSGAVAASFYVPPGLLTGLTLHFAYLGVGPFGFGTASESVAFVFP